MLFVRLCSTPFASGQIAFMLTPGSRLSESLLEPSRLYVESVLAPWQHDVSQLNLCMNSKEVKAWRRPSTVRIGTVSQPLKVWPDEARNGWFRVSVSLWITSNKRVNEIDTPCVWHGETPGSGRVADRARGSAETSRCETRRAVPRDDWWGRIREDKTSEYWPAGEPTRCSLELLQ